MKLIPYLARQYADALAALLKIGAAWDWAPGSFGDTLLLATAQELARLQGDVQLVIDQAIELHRPGLNSYTLADYQADADANTFIIPRKPAAIGCVVGYRLWSHYAAVQVDPPPVVVLSVVSPGVIGSTIGDLLWTVSSRYYIRVSYDYSLIDRKRLNAALMAFKQAHVYLFFEHKPNLYINPLAPFTWDNPSIHWDDPLINWY